MRLLSLRLTNFRQFYAGPVILEFAHGGRGNVTVVHGANGAGKTALLNALTWVLYQRVTPGFQRPDEIVNKRALREAGVGVEVHGSVVLEFDYNDARYRVTRSARARLGPDQSTYEKVGTPRVNLQWASLSTGEWRDEEAVADVIGRILPADLHTFFFFDGERIERLVQVSREQQKEIARATKVFLGVEVLHRAERHLKQAGRQLEDELADVGDAPLKELLAKKATAEADQDQANAELERLDADIRGLDNSIKEVEDRLRHLEGVKADQERRDTLQKKLADLKDAIAQRRVQQARLMSHTAYAIYAAPLLANFTALVADLRGRGELPVGIKRTFAQERLTLGRCICERPLVPGTPEFDAVSHWRDKGGLADVEEIALRMSGELQHVEALGRQFHEQFTELVTLRAKDLDDLARTKDSLDDISAKLENSPREEVSELERRRASLVQQRSDAKESVGGTRARIESLRTAIEELRAKVEQHQGLLERNLVIQRRVQVAEDARERIVKYRAFMEQEFRLKLGDRVQRLFRQLSFTPYLPRINDDYSLYLVESAGGPAAAVAPGQAESQVLSLCFIGSVIEQAREERARRDQLESADSSHYPIVMDSPFGSLDERYRTQVAEWVPQMADQVVLLVSKTQWRTEVENAFADKVGRAYVLCYSSPRDDIQPEQIVLEGTSYALVRRSPNEFEYTELMEVRRGR